MMTCQNFSSLNTRGVTAVEANSSLNEVLKHGDNFIMLRCLGVEPSWSEEGKKVIKAVGPKGIS